MGSKQTMIYLTPELVEAVETIVRRAKSGVPAYEYWAETTFPGLDSQLGTSAVVRYLMTEGLKTLPKPHKKFAENELIGALRSYCTARGRKAGS